MDRFLINQNVLNLKTTLKKYWTDKFLEMFSLNPKLGRNLVQMGLEVILGLDIQKPGLTYVHYQKSDYEAKNGIS